MISSPGSLSISSIVKMGREVQGNQNQPWALKELSSQLSWQHNVMLAVGLYLDELRQPCCERLLCRVACECFRQAIRAFNCPIRSNVVTVA